MPILKVGDNALWDSFSGLVPVKVLAITGESGPANSNQRVTIEVTKAKGPYRRGEVLDKLALWVIPREAIHQHSYSQTIGFYTVLVSN